jgi:hypothetical protein
LASEDDRSERRRAQLLDQMRTLAEQTHVAYVHDGPTLTLNKNPVFRYDDQPRRFIDATLWVWTDDGRPVAFQKIEAKYHVESDQPQWGYCFTSVSPELLAVRWPGDRGFRSTEAGIAFRPLPDAPPVAEASSSRRRQLRELARRFSSRMVIDPGKNVTQEMRLLPTPIHSYADPKTDLLRGAVFGLATNGVNPDVLVLLEAGRLGNEVRWQFAPVRMTSGGVTLKYDGASIWEVPWVNWTEAPFPTWTFFSTPRERVDDE